MTTVKDQQSGEVADIGPRGGSAWRRQYWVALLAVYCLGFAVYGANPYITFDKTEARLFPTRFDLQYWMIVVHVFAGVVTVALAWTQVWPWLRNTHPRVHRISGWIYILGGALPAGLLAIPTAILDTGGQSVRLALLTMAVLWLATTFIGAKAAMQRRFADHRKWMLRNVALATVVITARPLAFANLYLMHAVNPEAYPLEGYLTKTEMLSIGLWGALALHLVFVEWFLISRRRGSVPRTLARQGL